MTTRSQLTFTMRSSLRHHVPLLLALLIWGSACDLNFGDGAADDDSADDDDSAGEEDVKTAPVKVMSVALGSISESIASSATVDSDRRADILVEAIGTVENIHVEEGASVRAGQVLAELKNPQLATELKRSRAQFERSSDEFESVRGLYEKGFVARKEYDEAALAHDNARLSYEQAEEAETARRLTSPIQGVVSLRDLRFGEAVTVGKLAFQVVDLDKLKVEVNLPERDLARVEAGQRVLLRSEVLGGVSTEGHIQRISPVVDPASGTVKITIALAPGQAVLRPGMFVNVEIVVDTHDAAMLIPKKSIVYDGGDPMAFVVNAGKVERRKLELGYSEEETIEATSGLEVGDQIVVVGQALLRDGAEVRIVE